MLGTSAKLPWVLHTQAHTHTHNSITGTWNWNQFWTCALPVIILMQSQTLIICMSLCVFVCRVKAPVTKVTMMALFYYVRTLHTHICHHLSKDRNRSWELQYTMLLPIETHQHYYMICLIKLQWWIYNVLDLYGFIIEVCCSNWQNIY